MSPHIVCNKCHSIADLYTLEEKDAKFCPFCRKRLKEIKGDKMMSDYESKYWKIVKQLNNHHWAQQIEMKYFIFVCEKGNDVDHREIEESVKDWKHCPCCGEKL